jgi:hypothetical protein
LMVLSAAVDPPCAHAVAAGLVAVLICSIIPQRHASASSLVIRAMGCYTLTSKTIQKQSLLID